MSKSKCYHMKNRKVKYRSKILKHTYKISDSNVLCLISYLKVNFILEGTLKE